MDVHGLGVRSLRVCDRNAFQNTSNQATAKTQHLSVIIFFFGLRPDFKCSPMRCSEPKVGPIVVPQCLPPMFQLIFTVDGDGWGWMGIVTQISVNEQLYFVHICSDTGMC